MASLLLDTHAWVWSFADPDALSRPARTAIEAADAVLVSPISFFEIAQKARIGKWPEIEPILRDLPDLLRAQGGIQAPLTAEICLQAATLDWPHRDPFDRLLAATALQAGTALVTRDRAFESLPHLRTLW